MNVAELIEILSKQDSNAQIDVYRDSELMVQENSFMWRVVANLASEEG